MVKHNGTERHKDKGWEKIYETKSYFKKKAIVAILYETN